MKLLFPKHTSPTRRGIFEAANAQSIASKKGREMRLTLHLSRASASIGAAGARSARTSRPASTTLMLFIVFGRAITYMYLKRFNLKRN